LRIAAISDGAAFTHQHSLKAGVIAGEPSPALKQCF
jgi:hypothetical protein